LNYFSFFVDSIAMAKVDDLATLTELDENGILKELWGRYKSDIVYVSSLTLIFDIRLT
jgi:myosin heavy subunit